jgi:GT2 family glycosyltransferase
VVPDAATLAIVIVSYNVRDDLDACLRSLVGATAGEATHVVVVDNGSQDSTVAMVRERWPHVQVIEAGGNLGFARANNLGIRASASEFVLLLNPDTLVSSTAIAALIATLRAQPAAAIAGPRIVDADGTPELSFGYAISPLGELRQKVITSLHQRGVGAARSLVERWTRRAGTREWVSGACLLARRADLEALGLLDERYFMYTEDVDLCVEARKRGRDVLFVPDAQIVHLRGRSVRRNPDAERLRRQSHLAYYEKHHPLWVPVLRAYLQVTGKMPRK